MPDELDVNATEGIVEESDGSLETTPSQEQTPAPADRKSPDYLTEIQGLRDQLEAIKREQQSSRDRITNALQKRLREEFSAIDRLAKRNEWTPAEVAEQKAKAREEALDTLAQPDETPPSPPPSSAPPPSAPVSPAEAMAQILSHIEANTSLTAEDDEAIRIARKYSKVQPKTQAEAQQVTRAFNAELADAQIARKQRLAREKARQSDADDTLSVARENGSASGVLGASGDAGGLNPIANIEDPETLYQLARQELLKNSKRRR